MIGLSAYNTGGMLGYNYGYGSVGMGGYGNNPYIGMAALGSSFGLGGIASRQMAGDCR